MVGADLNCVGAASASQSTCQGRLSTFQRVTASFAEIKKFPNYSRDGVAIF
jgi:hypothetical protein